MSIREASTAPDQGLVRSTARPLALSNANDAPDQQEATDQQLSSVVGQALPGAACADRSRANPTSGPAHEEWICIRRMSACILRQVRQEPGLTQCGMPRRLRRIANPVPTSLQHAEE